MVFTRLKPGKEGRERERKKEREEKTGREYRATRTQIVMQGNFESWYTCRPAKACLKFIYSF